MLGPWSYKHKLQLHKSLSLPNIRVLHCWGNDLSGVFVHLILKRLKILLCVPQILKFSLQKSEKPLRMPTRKSGNTARHFLLMTEVIIFYYFNSKCRKKILEFWVSYLALGCVLPQLFLHILQFTLPLLLLLLHVEQPLAYTLLSASHICELTTTELWHSKVVLECIVIFCKIKQESLHYWLPVK